MSLLAHMPWMAPRARRPEAASCAGAAAKPLAASKMSPRYLYCWACSIGCPWKIQVCWGWLAGVHQHADRRAQHRRHLALPLGAHCCFDVLLQHLDEQAKQSGAQGVALPDAHQNPDKVRVLPVDVTATSEWAYSERMQAWMGPVMP
jgi:hypothetical protein